MQMIPLAASTVGWPSCGAAFSLADGLSVPPRCLACMTLAEILGSGVHRKALEEPTTASRSTSDEAEDGCSLSSDHLRSFMLDMDDCRDRAPKREDSERARPSKSVRKEVMDANEGIRWASERSLRAMGKFAGRCWADDRLDMADLAGEIGIAGV
jgi:hypothetical protein